METLAQLPVVLLAVQLVVVAAANFKTVSVREGLRGRECISLWHI